MVLLMILKNAKLLLLLNIGINALTKIRIILFQRQFKYSTFRKSDNFLSKSNEINDVSF